MIRKTILFLVICSFSFSCGKKVSNSDNGSNSDRDNRGGTGEPTSEVLRRFIDKQTNECVDELNCNESVAKLVIVDRQTIRYCTGTLVGADVIVTSSSCLTKSLKVPSLDCSQNIFAIFPKTTFLSEVTIGCRSIVSSDTNENVDPALWRSDFTFIKMQKKVNRKIIKISRKGLKENVPYRSYKVDYENDYDGYQKLTHCFPVYNSYANPYAQKRTSPMIPVRDCEYLTGNVGAPLMDFSGEIVGLFSGELDRSVGTYVLNANLLIEAMAPLHHVANTSCIKLPRSNTSTSINPECNKEISTRSLDAKRYRLLNSNSIHRKNKEKIKYDLENPVKYFKWKVEFFSSKKKGIIEPHFVKPKCFFDISNWISEFTGWRGRIREWTTKQIEVPNLFIETKLDRKLKPLSIVSENGVKKYSVSFNPRYAYNMQNTPVKIESVFQGSDVTHRYQGVTDQCELFE